MSHWILTSPYWSVNLFSVFACNNGWRKYFPSRYHDDDRLVGEEYGIRSWTPSNRINRFTLLSSKTPVSSSLLLLGSVC